MTKYKLIFTDTDTGDVHEIIEEEGICNLFKRSKQYIMWICRYARTYKLPRLKPEELLDTLFRDKFLQYREATIRIESDGEQNED